MVENIIIRKAKADEFDDVLNIASSLKEWFTKAGVRHIEQDLEFQSVFLAEAASGIVGFLSYFLYDGVGHIGWMGVLKDYHRNGIGEMLIKQFEMEMMNCSIATLQVYTLGDGVDYKPYEQTRYFYRKMGFKNYRVETTDNPECPESLTLRKKLTPKEN